MKKGFFVILLVLTALGTSAGSMRADAKGPDSVSEDVALERALDGRSYRPFSMKVAPAPETLAYLTGAFCGDGLCPGGYWQMWIVEDETSHWTPEELALVRRGLWAAHRVLADAGLDPATVLGGYRLRRHAGEFYLPERRYVAAVCHDTQEIILADAVFMRMDMFYLYHELGHVVDHRLNRELTAGLRDALGLEPGDPAPRGTWIRGTARDVAYELTADAFGIYLGRTYLDMASPAYDSTPAETDYDRIADAMAAALAAAAASP